jgi:hypothetical protein
MMKYDSDEYRAFRRQKVEAGKLIDPKTAQFYWGFADDAKLFGVPPEDRDLYLRLDNAKVNIARPSREATWFKLVGVRLNNGNEDYPSGDEVQTVEPWTPPKLWESLYFAQLNAALTEIDAGLPKGQRYSSAPNAGARAAWPIVQRHCPDRTEEQCREMIRVWVKNGVLVNKGYHDKVARKVDCIGLYLDPTKRPG